MNLEKKMKFIALIFIGAAMALNIKPLLQEDRDDQKNMHKAQKIQKQKHKEIKKELKQAEKATKELVHKQETSPGGIADIVAEVVAD